MLSYLEQTTALATSRGVSFKAAVLHAGISDAQYYRWLHRSTKMSEPSARKLCKAIEQLSAAAARAAAQVKRAVEEPADADAAAG